MAESFFFYDLETSGFSPRDARIMQFAGRRTDMQLNPIGEPFDVLVKITDEILPDVDATFITGITPQATITDGLTEAEFLQQFCNEIALPGTIFVGFNTVRFDDEFMRFLHYRNFYDPYEWQWQDQRGKWDMLDVVRMTRALRPEGIEWPFDAKGKPTNRLELLTALNKLEHEHAHDALSDVEATIAVARLIRQKQAKLFDYLFELHDKKKVAEFIDSNPIFVYASGRYSSEHEKTTVVANICSHPKRPGEIYVYDLRYDPADWLAKTPEQLAESWKWKKVREDPILPVKSLKFNHCPAVAPLGVLDDASKERLHIDLDAIKKHYAAIKNDKSFAEKLRQAAEILESQRQSSLFADQSDVDGRVYDGFYDVQDKNSMRVVRAADPSELGKLDLHLNDDRLSAMLPLYKARNYPKQLTGEEREAWEKFRANRLLGGGANSRMAKYMNRLQQVAADPNLTGHQRYLLEELKLYAESIMPEVD